MTDVGKKYWKQEAQTTARVSKVFRNAFCQHFAVKDVVSVSFLTPVGFSFTNISHSIQELMSTYCADASFIKVPSRMTIELVLNLPL